MKKMMFVAMMMTIAISANAMSYTTAKNEALFLSDKMAYELNLTVAQYDAVYEINLDYFLSVNGRNDVFGPWWNRRNADLRYVLTAWQYDKYVTLNYFYRPMEWKAGGWTFTVYAHYTNKSHFYKGHPKGLASYKGGNNKKHDRYYADRKVNMPAPAPTAKHGNDKKNNGNGSTWRMTTGKNGKLAQNTPRSPQKEKNKNNGSGHFSGRR